MSAQSLQIATRRPDAAWLRALRSEAALQRIQISMAEVPNTEEEPLVDCRDGVESGGAGFSLTVDGVSVDAWVAQSGSRAPAGLIELRHLDPAGGPTLVRATRPAVIDPLSARAAREAIEARLAEVALWALRPREDWAGGVCLGGIESERPTGGASAFLGRLHRAAGRLLRGEFGWIVAWRRRQEGDVPALSGEWRILPEPEHRYLADPFLVEDENGAFLFVEDYCRRAAKGRIAAIPWGPEGPQGAPRIVLEAEHHMSFPCIVDTPSGPRLLVEAGSSGRVDLYRSQTFPWRWEHDCTLLELPRYADPVLSFDQGLWWLELACGRGASAIYDETRLFFAEDVRGPYRPHPANPICWDAIGARAGGPLIRTNGRTLRVGQDCSDGYGRGLVFFEVLERSPSRYRETKVGAFRPAPERGAYGLHAYTRSERFEAIDLCVRSKDARRLIEAGRIVL
jgi:hypothetical protein